MTGDVQITLCDVYDAQQETRAQVAALNGQMALLTAQVSDRLDSDQKMLSDHEDRIRVAEQTPKVQVQDFEKLEDRVGSLESWRGKAIGAGLTLAALTGVAAVLIDHAMAH